VSVDILIPALATIVVGALAAIPGVLALFFQRRKNDAETKNIVEQTDELIWNRSKMTIQAMQNEIDTLRKRLNDLNGIEEENQEMRRDLDRLMPLIDELSKRNAELEEENKQLRQHVTTLENELRHWKGRVTQLEKRAKKRDTGELNDGDES